MQSNMHITWLLPVSSRYGAKLACRVWMNAFKKALHMVIEMVRYLDIAPLLIFYFKPVHPYSTCHVRFV